MYAKVCVTSSIGVASSTQTDSQNNPHSREGIAPGLEPWRYLIDPYDNLEAQCLPEDVPLPGC